MNRRKNIKLSFLLTAYTIILLHSIIPHHHHDTGICSCEYSTEVNISHSDHDHDKHQHHHEHEHNDLSNCSCEIKNHSESHFCHFTTDIYNINIDFSDLFTLQTVSDIQYFTVRKKIINTNNERIYYYRNSSGILKRGPPSC